MANPIIPSAGPVINQPPVIPPALPQTGGSTPVDSQDSFSLYDFLQLVGTNKQDNRQATFDNQATTALVNREYFLGVYEQLSVLAEKLKEIIDFSTKQTKLVTDYNDSVTDLNVEMNSYNSSLGTLNSQISTMNNAINTINSQAPPTPAQIADYNNAATTYNNYLTATGNPALLSYAASAETLYNIPTNLANTETIPDINEKNEKLGFDIPLQPLLTPATAPVGATAPLAAAQNYSGPAIPLINPSSYSTLNNLTQLPPPLPERDLISTYFTPFALKYLSTLSATQQKLSDFDQSVDAKNFFIKQGFDFDPSKASSFISRSPVPDVGQSSGNGVGSSLSFSIGASSPNVIRALSTALFLSTAKESATPIPPAIFDQLNVLAASILPRLGLAAGLSVVQQLGDKLKSLPPDSPLIEIALAAAFSQSILKIVSDKTATQDAVSAILKQIPEITEEEVKTLTDKLVAAQNISLLLFGALQTGVTLKNPNFVTDLLNTTTTQPISTSPPQNVAPPNNLNQGTTQNNIRVADRESNASIINEAASRQDNVAVASNTTESQSIPIPVNENPPISVRSNTTSISDVLRDQVRSDTLKSEIASSLVRNASISESEAQNIASNAVSTAQRELQPNGSALQLQQILAREFTRQGLANDQSQFLAQTATPFFNPQEPVIRPNLTTSELNNQIRLNIANVAPIDSVNLLSTLATENFINSLTNPALPGSFVNLMKENLKAIAAANEAAIADAVEAQRVVFANPDAQVAKILIAMQDPAMNIIKSYLAGPMYSNAISSKWEQPPLSILV